MNEATKDKAFVVFGSSLGIALALSIAFGIGTCIDYERDYERTCLKQGAIKTTVGGYRACVKFAPVAP